MARRKVLLSKTALRQLERLNRDVEARIRRQLPVLEEDPFRPRPAADIRPLWSHDDPPLYRLRIGDYRVLDSVLGEEVRVTEILHRSQGYRGLD